MSPVSLPTTHRAHPEPARVAALSAAIALNVAVILIAARPIMPTGFPLSRPLAPVALVRLIVPPPVPAPPPPVEIKPLPRSLPTPRVVPRPTRIMAPAVLSRPQGRTATAPFRAPVAISDEASDPPASSTPVEASLAYLAHPVTYPLSALRGRLQGTLLLRVLVDETGRPLQVSVMQGSGSSLLDRSAREQVLASWRFRPAVVNGQAVRSWARVPVTFALRG